jgi:hypothetical protein
VVGRGAALVPGRGNTAAGGDGAVSDREDRTYPAPRLPHRWLHPLWPWDEAEEERKAEEDRQRGPLRVDALAERAARAAALEGKK